MLLAKDILTAIGFTTVPQALEHIYPNENECAAWFGLIDFEEAVCFYGLNKHKVFKAYQSEIGNNKLLKTAVFVFFVVDFWIVS